MGHLHLIMGNPLPPAVSPQAVSPQGLLRGKPCPVAGRTGTAWTSPAQPLALPVVSAAPSVSGAHWGLTAPPCRMHHCGLSSFNQSTTNPAGFHAEGTGCCHIHHATSSHVMLCHSSQQGRAGLEQGWCS